MFLLLSTQHHETSVVHVYWDCKMIAFTQWCVEDCHTYHKLLKSNEKRPQLTEKAIETTLKQKNALWEHNETTLNWKMIKSIKITLVEITVENDEVMTFESKRPKVSITVMSECSPKTPQKHELWPHFTFGQILTWWLIYDCRDLLCCWVQHVWSVHALRSNIHIWNNQKQIGFADRDLQGIVIAPCGKATVLHCKNTCTS